MRPAATAPPAARARSSTTTTAPTAPTGSTRTLRAARGLHRVVLRHRRWGQVGSASYDFVADFLDEAWVVTYAAEQLNDQGASWGNVHETESWSEPSR